MWSGDVFFKDMCDQAPVAGIFSLKMHVLQACCQMCFISKKGMCAAIFDRTSDG